MIHAHPRRRYAALALALMLILATFAIALSARAGAAVADGVVSVYPGPERPGLERRACGFVDGIFIMRGEISAQRVIVTDPINREYYRSRPIPDLQGYAVQSLHCVRSTQTGLLVVVVGGFRAGSGGQQSLTLATDYPIAEPISHEEYEEGRR